MSNCARNRNDPVINSLGNSFVLLTVGMEMWGCTCVRMATVLFGVEAWRLGVREGGNAGEVAPASQIHLLENWDEIIGTTKRFINGFLHSFKAPAEFCPLLLIILSA